jgi:hypothetical protein
LIKPDTAQALLVVRSGFERVRAETLIAARTASAIIDRAPRSPCIILRAREIDVLSSTPQSLRVARYLDERVRRVSDDVAAIAGLSALPGELQERFAKKQKRVSRFRQAMAHLAEVLPMDSVAATPLPRGTAE